jgi:vacuolar-type H+-ATPase subunit E/Vma4
LGLQELLNSLRVNEQKQIDSIWQEAKNEAEKLRKQVDEATADITKNHTDQLASACQKSMRSIFSETEISVRTKKLFAYQALEQTLRRAATAQLPALKDENYEDVFARLVAEIPERKWERIIVNPADLDLAANFFTANIIHTDPAISGGLIVTSAEGKIIVDNTFERRLERKWHHILPEIIANLEQRYEKSGTAENTG